jgi:hypothetical protein
MIEASRKDPKVVEPQIISWLVVAGQNMRELNWYSEDRKWGSVPGQSSGILNLGAISSTAFVSQPQGVRWWSIFPDFRFEPSATGHCTLRTDSTEAEPGNLVSHWRRLQEL